TRFSRDWSSDVCSSDLSGEIRINGQPIEITDSQAAIRAGIGMVFQHFKLVQNFTVLENVILGAEDGRLLRPSLARARRELAHLRSEERRVGKERSSRWG